MFLKAKLKPRTIFAPFIVSSSDKAVWLDN